MDVNLFDLNATLTWLAAGGGALLFSVIASRGLERLPGWTNLDSGIKYFLSVVGGGLIGLAAWAVVTYVPAETLAAIAPAYGAFMLSALGVGGLQFTHAIAKSLAKPKSS